MQIHLYLPKYYIHRQGLGRSRCLSDSLGFPAAPLPISSILKFQFGHSVLSDSLWPHRLQHDRPPCPSPTPGAYSNSCPLSQWWHPTISSSVIPFSSRLQSFPASESFPMSQFFTSGGQIGVSASASVLPVNPQDWSPCSPRESQESSQTPQFKSINSSVLGFFILHLSHPYMTTRKTIALTRWTFVGK